LAAGVAECGGLAFFGFVDDFVVTGFGGAVTGIAFVTRGNSSG